jgi:hypothetical protein
MPITNCKICKNEFYIKPSHLKIGWGKYCSIKCRITGQRKGRIVLCEICGNETWKTPKDFNNTKSGKFFCSRSCQTIWRNQVYSGEKHYLWKGGEFVYRKKLLKSGKLPICQRCGVKDKRILDVHHIDKNRKNTNLDNLVWLCRNCHYLVHNHEEKI